jgi:hypothetical protein
MTDIVDRLVEMTDIVTRLAQWAENDMRAESVALDAKHEIEELRKALEAIVLTTLEDSDLMVQIARSALQQKESE